MLGPAEWMPAAFLGFDLVCRLTRATQRTEPGSGQLLGERSRMGGDWFTTHVVREVIGSEGSGIGE